MAGSRVITPEQKDIPVGVGALTGTKEHPLTSKDIRKTVSHRSTSPNAEHADSNGSAFDRVIDAFQAHGLIVDVKSGGRACAQAPGHSVADRSVAVTATAGQVLIHSHSDPTPDVLAAVGLAHADLFDNPKGVTYDYADGRRVHRSPAKTFRQSGNTKGRSLFRVENLSAHPDATVYVAEGEKDVLALEAVGAVAVCSAGGAGKAHLFDWTPLRGRTVVVVADADKPGYMHAAGVAAQLSEVAESVRVVQARTGKDAADHIAAGHSIAEFVAAPMESVTAESVAVSPGGRLLKVVRGSEVKTKRLEWVIPDWVPAGALTLLAGREGLGKSTIAASLCAQITRGTLEGSLYGQPRNVLYVHSEDARDYTVTPRLQAAGADLDRVLFVDVATETSECAPLVLPLDTAALEQIIAANEVAFVVLDAAASAMASNLRGNDNNDVRAYLEPISQLAARQNCAVLGLVHFGKRDGTDTGKLILGSLAWSQVARSVLSMAKDDETGNLVVSNTKANLASHIRSMEAVIESVSVTTDDGDAEVGVLRWLGESHRNAVELLGGDDDVDGDDRSEAEAWLEDFLTEQGSAAAKEVKAEARKQGIAERTVKRAAKKLGVVYSTSGFPRTTHWALPAQSGQPGRTQPTHGPTGPTGPTGPDQHKHDGPTGSNPQSGHAHESGPTDNAPTLQLITVDAATEPACPVCGRAHDDLALDSAALCNSCRTSGKYLTSCAVCGRDLPPRFGFDRHHACRTMGAAS
ncbi:AAA family ATPase [Nocardia sp. CDC159]|uniref:AAA family ATPase n=1 Tax=Nocardia pulmonis TaxID=2951408 RepID=A0A9X2E8V1_9NOCA|nr:MULTISPECIES: AAA family ATPase [Nocardia]MCM6776442.1 AAA family ATPase [Nocardia pulmonis]MCM6788866.1 AAA family ATPase [Nocardia sp. CDC159]